MTSTPAWAWRFSLGSFFTFYRPAVAFLPVKQALKSLSIDVLTSQTAIAMFINLNKLEKKLLLSLGLVIFIFPPPCHNYYFYGGQFERKKNVIACWNSERRRNAAATATTQLLEAIGLKRLSWINQYKHHKVMRNRYRMSFDLLAFRARIWHVANALRGNCAFRWKSIYFKTATRNNIKDSNTITFKIC